MEKRIFGIVLTILGIIGLIMAAMEFAESSNSVYDWKLIGIYGILGAIFFFTGIGLIRTTKDVIKKNERVSE